MPCPRLAAWLLVLAAGAATAPAHAEPRDVRPLSGAAGAIRFVVDVPEPALEPAGEVGQTVRLAVDGYQGVAPQGHPLLPGRVVMVAVPPTGEVTVSASATAVQVLDDVRLARAPLTPQGRDAESSESRAKAEAQAQALAEAGDLPPAGLPPPVPGVRARLVDVGWMRNQRVARVEITPADYDVAARRLSVARRIEVEVAVSGALAPSAGARPAEDPDPFERLYRETVVNYEQGRAWRREAGSAARSPGFGARDAAPMRDAGVVPNSSIYAGRQWIKLAVGASGFYKVRFAEMRNLALFGGRTTTPLDSLRLYTLPGFPVLPEDNYCDLCDYREVAMGFVQVTANGILDQNEEYLYFYALGASDWASIYDPALPDTVFINHPYEKTNYYYLTIGTPALEPSATPKRITTVDGNPALAGGSEVTPATFDARLHYEVDAQYWPNAWPFRGSTLFWEKWFWQIVELGKPPFQVIADAPGVDTAQPSRMRMRCWGVTQLIEKSFGIRDHYLDVMFNDAGFGRRSWNGLNSQTYDTTLVGLVAPSNTLSLQVPDITDPNPSYDANRVDVTALAWLDLFYARRFEPVADALEFDSSPAGGSYLYKIGRFSAGLAAPPRVFDVTDPLAPIEIQGGVLADDTLTFLRVESGQRRYRVFPDARIEQLTNATVFMAPSSSLNNLRAAPDTVQTGAAYLVIYYDGFKETADLLAEWRRTRLPLQGVSGPYATATVPISAVYDQFSGGRTDPGAIRNFLRAAFFNWAQPPVFVTLLGDASYDFKDIQGYAPEGLPGTLLPAYEGGYVVGLSSQFATDDWMLNVNNAVAVIPDFFGGRIPAGDAVSAMAFVRDKLLPYERSAPLGEWRNRVMLIGDDHEQGSRPDGFRWTHMRQTAELDTATVPHHIDRAYVYLHTYPDGTSDTKPGAKADVIKNLNGEGVVMWNFVGHGSPFKISDESVFLDSDAGSLTNATRPGLFVAASCDVGKYHDPSVQSLGERLVMNPGGGCIGVVSATELAFSNDNAELNKILYRRLFARDTGAAGTGQYYTTISEALLAAKTGDLNDQKYQLMGDAATRLNLPRHWVELTLKDSDGNTVDTLQRGGIFRFDGRVLDQPGGTLVPFTGSAAVLIEDSAPIEMTFSCPAVFPFPACSPIPYRFRAAPAFRGDARVLDGTFTGQFVVPLDAVLGARGRIRGYVSGDAAGIATETDGAGSDTLTLISGTAPSGDNEGPRIGLSFPSGSTAVRPDAELRIDLSDDHGILITGHTVQNGIIVTIDNNSNTRVDVTSSFRYSPNSYQAGKATFTLPGLAPGPHTIAVSAADNLASGINAAQHRSSATINFEVSALPPLRVQRAFLFPNPTRSGGPDGGGLFVIDAPGDPVNVLLHLYTVSGRLIRTLKAFGGQGQVQIPWDGLDAEGDRLANGTYLFMVQVNGREADGTSSARSRAVAEGRVVVVGR